MRGSSRLHLPQESQINNRGKQYLYSTSSSPHLFPSLFSHHHRLLNVNNLPRRKITFVQFPFNSIQSFSLTFPSSYLGQLSCLSVYLAAPVDLLLPAHQHPQDFSLSFILFSLLILIQAPHLLSLSLVPFICTINTPHHVYQSSFAGFASSR